LAGFGEIWQVSLVEINEIKGLNGAIWRLAAPAGFSGPECALRALKTRVRRLSWGRRRRIRGLNTSAPSPRAASWLKLL
jgi:hypothetical protein